VPATLPLLAPVILPVQVPSPLPPAVPAPPSPQELPPLDYFDELDFDDIDDEVFIVDKSPRAPGYDTDSSVSSGNDESNRWL